MDTIWQIRSDRYTYILPSVGKLKVNPDTRLQRGIVRIFGTSSGEWSYLSQVHFYTCHIWNMSLLRFMAKNHDLSDNFFSVCHVPLPYAKFVPRLQPRPLDLES
jgi:hypothetical protein